MRGRRVSSFSAACAEAAARRAQGAAKQTRPFTRNAAVSNHIWSGFNLAANLAYRNRLPGSLREIVHAAVKRHVARERDETVALNAALAESLAQQGIEFSVLSPAHPPHSLERHAAALLLGPPAVYIYSLLSRLPDQNGLAPWLPPSDAPR